MSARPNPRARQNRQQESRELTAPGKAFVSLEAAAERLFDETKSSRLLCKRIVLRSLPGSENLRENVPAQEAHAGIRSEDARLRLTAALCYLCGFVESGTLARSDFHRIFNDVLAESENERFREFSAASLASLFLCYEFSSAAPTEIQSLIDYLNQPRTRHAALVGLSYLGPSMLNVAPLRSPSFARKIGQLLRDETLHPMDQLLALKLAGICNARREVWESVSLRVLREADLTQEDLHDLLAMLVRQCSVTGLIALLRDPSLSQRRREAIVTILTTQFRRQIFWSDWKALVTRDVEPEIGAKILRSVAVHSRRAYVHDVLSLAAEPDIPVAWQAEILLALAHSTGSLREEPQTSKAIDEVLIQIGSNPEVAERLLRECPIGPFCGTIDSDIQDRAIRVLRDPHTPLAVRYLLGRGFLSKGPLDPEDARTLVGLWIQAAVESSQQGIDGLGEAVWSDLNRYVASQKALAQQVCDDERVPTKWRIPQLTRAPRQSIVKIARLPALSESERAQVMKALARHIPGYCFPDAWRPSPQGNDVLSTVLQNAPEFFSDEADALLRVCGDATKSGQLRWLAAEWAGPLVEKTPGTLPWEDAALKNLPLSALALLAARVQPQDRRAASYCQRLARRFAQLDPESTETSFLAAFLLRHAEVTLAELCVDASLPVAHRRSLRDHIMAQVTTIPEVEVEAPVLTWKHWRDGVLRSLTAPDEEVLVDLFARNTYGEHWPDLLRAARRTDLSVGARSALFRGIWSAARYLTSQYGGADSLFPLLLDLAADPFVVDRAYQGEYVPPYTAFIDPASVARILEIVRDHQRPLNYRFLFAHCLPANLSVSHELREEIIDAMLSGTNDAWMAGATSQILELVESHLKREPGLARKILLHHRLPRNIRFSVLQQTDRQTLLWYLTQVAVADPDRETLCRFVERHAHGEIARGLHAALVERGEVWRQLVASPEFLSYDLSAITTVALDFTRPRFLRDLARYWAHADAFNTSDGVAYLLGSIVERLTDPQLNGEEADELIDFANSMVSRDPVDDAVVNIVMGMCANARIAEIYRQTFLTNLTDYFVRQHAERLWEWVSTTPDPRLRASVFNRLVAEKYFVATPDATHVNSRLHDATTPEEIAEATRLWEPIARLRLLLNADTLTLVRIARNSSEPEIVRRNAIHRLEKRSRLDNQRIRPFLAYLTTPEGKSLWEDANTDPLLKRALCALLLEWFGNPSLRPTIENGPRSLYWKGLIELSLLPDQVLSRRVLRSVQPLDENMWGQWRDTYLPDVPAGIQLVLGCYLYRQGASGAKAARVVNHAFALCHGRHTRSAELTDALTSAMIAPERIRERLGSLIERCSESSLESPANPAQFVTDLVRVLRYGQIEAQMVAQDRRTGGDFQASQEPDLSEAGRSSLVPIPNDAHLADAANALRGAIMTRFKALLPKVTSAQLDRVLRETEAPALLAAHYCKAHPAGLPLLGEAIRAEAGDEVDWVAWRYDRPEARQQLAHLSEEQVGAWRENLELPVGLSEIPSEVAEAGRRIRECFRRAAHDGELSTDLVPLVRDVLCGKRAPAQHIQLLQELNGVLGRKIGGQAVALPPDATASLSRDILCRLHDLLSAESTIAQRPELIAWRHRLDRAIDLVRLLHCDARALARNTLLAVGEPESNRSRTESAVAHFEQMLHAFSRPPTRQQHAPVDPRTAKLLAALTEARAILREVKTFATNRELIAAEHDDFKTLLEIGNQPYGQGSCQNYASASNHNHALLAYAVDAMTKVIVIRTSPTPEDPRGTYLARAIVRLGKATDTGAPVLVLERTYAAGRERALYEPQIRKVAKHFADARGWRIVIPESLPYNRAGNVIPVAIPASQNGIQYEDGWEFMVDSRTAMPTKAYVLKAVEI